MFRPSKLGRDPEYALSDPGHEYIPGVTETFIGPLAEHLGVAGQRATLEARTNLYRGLTPDGSQRLLDRGVPFGYRPVAGGNYHCPKTLKYWMGEQPDPDRKRAERAFSECCADAARATLLSHLESRTGQAGARTRVPAAGMLVGFQHLTDSAGHYHPHFLVEVHNAGLCPDGKVRAVDPKVFFDRQQHYSVEAEARLMVRLHQEFNITLRYTPDGTLEVKGLEAFRDVRTPRQEEIAAELNRRGQENTHKNRARAARDTHRKRDPKLTVADALRRARQWVQQHGLSARAAVREKVEQANELFEGTKAEMAVRAAAKAVGRFGEPVAHQQLATLALREGIDRGADLARVRDLVDRMKAGRTRYGLQKLDDGRYTTAAVERSRARAYATVTRMENRRAKRPRSSAFLRLELSATPPAAHALAAAKELRSRATVVDAPTAATRVLVDAHVADNRAVYAVGSDHTAAELRKFYAVNPQAPEAFARRLGKTGLWETFLEMRRHRWKGVDHVGELYRHARRPRVELKRGELVVLDTRKANAHAVKHITRAAKKAGATLVVIGGLEPREMARTHTKSRGHDQDR